MARGLNNWPKRGCSVIMLIINTASHLLKLCVEVSCSKRVTGTRSEQLAERGLWIIMLIINTASHLLKLCVVLNCSSGLTGNFTVQHLFAGYHFVTVIPPTQEVAVLGSRKNTVRVRNITQRVNSLCFI